MCFLCGVKVSQFTVFPSPTPNLVKRVEYKQNDTTFQQTSTVLSCFAVVFLRQQKMTNLDEKCKIGIQNAIPLQRGCEVQMHASVYQGNLHIFSRGRNSHVLLLESTSNNYQTRVKNTK